MREHALRASPPEAAFTLLELLVALSLFAIMLGIAIPNLKDLNNPLRNGTAALTSFLKEVRGKAISSTSAYRITPVSTTRIVTSFATNCSSETFIDDPSTVLELEAGARLNATSWVLCFNPRGLADDNEEIVIRDQHGDAKVVKVYLGGGAKIL